MSIKLGGENSGTQWVCDNKVIYVHKLVIQGVPGNYNVEYTPSVMCRIKALFGLGPTSKDVEVFVRTQMLGESGGTK